MEDRSRSRRSLKRSRWMTTAVMFIAAAVLVDLDTSYAFSPTAEGFSNQGIERRSRPPSKGKDDGRTTTDLNVAVSPLNIYSPPNPKKKGRKITQARVANEIISLPSRSVALRKRTGNKALVRPRGRNTGVSIDRRKQVSTSINERLSKDEERKLTHSIRSLRRAVRIRDELVENTDDIIPTETDWAQACGLSVLGLRRVMYEGQQARTILVSANAGLVTSIAKRHYYSLKQATESGGGLGTILTLQDMIQEGNLGLMQAAERFEPEREFRFSTYATYWIRQRILRSISDSSRIIRLPAHIHSMLQKIRKARKDMTLEIGREPSDPELAHYMEISVDEIRKVSSRSRNVVSLELPLRRGGSLKEDRRTIGDMVMSDAPTPDENAQSQYLKHEIRAVINELPERERDVLVLRFGLDDGSPMTVNQTAKHLGISSDRVRVIEARALNKLRSPQRNYRLKEYVGGQVEEPELTTEARSSPEKLWFF